MARSPKSSRYGNLVLPEFYEVVRGHGQIDVSDWTYITLFAAKWKMSVADALLDLHYLDETSLARSLAKAHGLPYVSGQMLKCDFSEIDFDQFDDLLSVGAAPLEDNRLAICNPYDDHRGNLSAKICQREMVVTERNALFQALRAQGLQEWLNRDESE